ncbi:hypothetical protein PFICI_03675 [Pestalotiopsis fici W106-1]|uniref:RxLR effector protein n=1 Tax=Pestalotiopsis fici (strain W106-1 / CGMCC3.15140) TaxID=1229662 RepID=W3XI06_PESFW|nr:uncharacterized protein PFICI_03675 [Pestalotiopsis fici W106-1]ETS85650.1 hypothetical protein PFICI_03675 [Pestalotiopsis fici W106-1]
MKLNLLNLAFAVLAAPAATMPVEHSTKPGEVLADKFLLGSSYKREEPSSKVDVKRNNEVDADEYDLRSAWAKRNNEVDADEYDLRSAWAKRNNEVDADEYDLRSAWAKKD